MKNLRFDFICANPPLLPIPFNLNYPFVGDGGTDGLSIFRQIMNYGIPHLSKNGKIVTLGLSGGSEVGPDIYCLAEQLQMKYQMKFILTILSRVEITPQIPMDSIYGGYDQYVFSGWRIRSHAMKSLNLIRMRILALSTHTHSPLSIINVMAEILQ